MWIYDILPAPSGNRNDAGGWFNMENPPKTHLKLKSHEISFVYNRCPLVSKFCSQYVSSMQNFKTMDNWENVISRSEFGIP